MEKVIYYSDELNDDFAGTNIKEVPLPPDFKYTGHGPFWKALSFFIYRIIATPVAYLVCKLHYGVKYVNRKALKKCKGGYFLYINHTMVAGDAFNPSIAAFPKKTDIIVSNDAVSNGFLRVVVPMLGGMPVPGGLKQVLKFKKAIDESYEKGHCITIYPEAHIWKYYTGIRPFTDVSFKYPAELDAPVYCATVTYKRRKFIKRPKAEVFIDGPFYADAAAPMKTRQKQLRDAVYNTMVARAENSNCEYIKYVRKEKEAEEEGIA